MLEESSPDVRLAADPLEAGADLTAQATQIVGRRVGQGRGIQVPPEEFQRIQLRGVRWQPLDAQPAPMAHQRLGHQPAPMGGQAIPQQNHPAPHMPTPGGEEPHDMRAANGPGVERQKPPRPPAGGRRQHGANPREVLPGEGLPHEGRVPFGGPGRPNRGPLGEAALVEEAQRGL